jgi:galactitol-specific phosphotransferase system IIB component
MKILTVCDQGCNRSVMFAHLLKYWNNDTIPIGLKNTSNETLTMLFNWAEIILLTAKDQKVPPKFEHKVLLCDVGPDTYPRPFNKDLHEKVKRYLDQYKERLKQL